ncbi:polyprenal reductase [Calliopsis andreniformis]|uniref:polyprenal reductase n=1 Tax=Calliopsis andreniformis TaxID=337506 RepID=UPI003FCE7658
MQVNIIRFLFIFSTVFTAILGLLINYVESYLPVLLSRFFRYGKFSCNVYEPIIAQIEVPKRWFKHFYIFAAPTSSCILYLCIYKYFLNGNIPETIIWILNATLGENRQPLVSPESTFLATLLLCLHCWKRFYETQCVNIFSNKMINISHYLVGFYHYIGTFLCVIGESIGFVEGSEGNFSWQNITYIQLACAIIFILSSYTQLKANYILRSLRKDKGNKTNSAVYKIPHGGLFEYVSGALHITEMIIYLTLSIILWKSITFHCVLLWVLVNQISTAVLTHKWYLQTFKNYPTSRKILIPYLF